MARSKREPNKVRSIQCRLARRLKAVDAIADDLEEMVASLPAPSREELLELEEEDVKRNLPIEARLIGVLRLAHYYLAEACTVVRDYAPRYRPFDAVHLRQLWYEVRNREEADEEEESWDETSEALAGKEELRGEG